MPDQISLLVMVFLFICLGCIHCAATDQIQCTLSHNYWLRNASPKSPLSKRYGVVLSQEFLDEVRSHIDSMIGASHLTDTQFICNRPQFLFHAKIRCVSLAPSSFLVWQCEEGKGMHNWLPTDSEICRVRWLFSPPSSDLLLTWLVSVGWVWLLPHLPRCLLVN